MPSWKEILERINLNGSNFDIARREYLKALYEYTGRNVIALYSGWLQRQGDDGFAIDDEDKNGLMACIHKLDRSKGLDLILHTPGGNTAATESIVDYLRAMFGTNIRAIVPQLAMSAGTMIACACKEIVLGKHSSLGPIDPQIMGLPAHGVIEEFNRALIETQKNPRTIPIWQQIVAKYPPVFVGECQKAIDWSQSMTVEWLKTGMFSSDPDAETKAENVVKEIGDHAVTLAHNRHLSLQRCKEIGLKIVALEDDQDLQELVLTIHHSFMLTFSQSTTFKIIENHSGVASIKVQKLFLAQN